MRSTLFATRFVSILVPMVLVAGCCATLPPEPAPEPVVVTPPPKIGGIGALLREDTLADGTRVLIVDKVVLGGPAEAAGITRRMVIWTVEGQPATDVQVAVTAIRGPVGTSVALEAGMTLAEKKTLTVVRAEVDSEKVACEAGDCVNGTGTQLDAFGDRYQGGFQNGRFHGQGKFVEKTGRVFEGTFVEGFATGPGVVVMADGNKIEGEFKGGYVVGKAKRTAPNGDLYEGEFRQFQADGQGVYTRPSNGDTWTGTFVRDQFMNGAWVHHVESGAVCTRQVTGGALAATGQITYPAGDKKKRVTFDGAFGDDCVANGEGIMTYVRGKKQGPFLNDEPQKGVKNIK